MSFSHTDFDPYKDLPLTGEQAAVSVLETTQESHPVPDQIIDDDSLNLPVQSPQFPDDPPHDVPDRNPDTSQDYGPADTVENEGDKVETKQGDNTQATNSRISTATTSVSNAHIYSQIKHREEKPQHQQSQREPQLQIQQQQSHQQQLHLQQQLQQMQQKPQPQQRSQQPQEVDENGIPVDMVKAMNYIQESVEEYKEVDLSERLLRAKQEEDEGVQQDSDFEGEDFEDLLEMFDIDPEEISLDLSLNERQQLLIEAMDNEELSRYEFFRRTNLNTNGIKRLVNNSIGQTISNDFAKIIAGVGKVFVGEIVEKAKEVQRKQNEAKVLEQLEYKRDLRKYEVEVESYNNEVKRRKLANEPLDDLPEVSTIAKPVPPSFLESNSSSTDANNNATGNAASPPSLDNAVSFNGFRITIPDSSTQLSPDHIREAWRLYQEENNTVVQGRWRQQGGGNGWMFR